jgi:indole-3-glycerol phosphate synthase (EC 4.1.1.48)
VNEVVEDVLRSVESRLDALEPRSFSIEARDLVGSARSLRSKGITPIIAEIKPRILGRFLLPEEVAQRARVYETMGACAVSVLTEPTYFFGSPENVRIAREATSLPVLRKEFVLDSRQLSEVESDLVLLIAAFSRPLDDLVDAVRSFGMVPLVEVHTEDELDLALRTDARIVGINNRNLRTLDVDLRAFERLAPLAKEVGVFLVAESGVQTREDACRMVDAGADVLLVGTALMEDPEKLRELNGSGG